MKISAVIIAFNEEDKIASALRSVDWADDILVVDSGSTDRTSEIAEQHRARVIRNEWPGFSRQKQFAADNALHDRVLSLDADEVVSDELRDELLSLNGKTDIADGYYIPRLAFYFDKPIRHSGWYPDKQLRFFDRRKGRWSEKLVHESFEMLPGTETAELRSDIFHYSVENAAHHHQMIGERYAPLSARQMFESGKRTNPLRVALAGPSAFFRTYILKAGFLDGFAGFCIARFAAHHGFLKHLMLWEMQRKENPAK